MVRKCIVKDCDSICPINPINTEGPSFFSFPTNKDLSEDWREAIYLFNHQKLRKTVSNDAVVCEKHFEEIHLIRNGNRCHLHCRAVPIIFPNDDENECSDDLYPFKRPLTEPHEEHGCVSTEANAKKHQKEDCNTKETNVMEETNGEQTCRKESFECERCGYVNSNRTRSIESLPHHTPENHSENSNSPVFKNDPLSCGPSQSNHCIFDPQPSTSGIQMKKKKRIHHPSDLQEDEQLGETPQEYVVRLEDKIAELRVIEKFITQRNRRCEKKITTLQNRLKEMKEKRKKKKRGIRKDGKHPDGMSLTPWSKGK